MILISLLYIFVKEVLFYSWDLREFFSVPRLKLMDMSVFKTIEKRYTSADDASFWNSQIEDEVKVEKIYQIENLFKFSRKSKNTGNQKMLSVTLSTIQNQYSMKFGLFLFFAASIFRVFVGSIVAMSINQYLARVYFLKSL